MCLVRCKEHYVNGAEAAALPFDDALAGSHSLALLDGVATLEECAWLREQAGAAADEERLLRLSQTDSDAERRSYGEDGMRCDGQTGRIRAPVTRLLGAEGQALCDAILQRAVARLNEVLPGLLDRLFGTGVLSRTLLHNQGLVFSPGEPALNVYGPGGHFDAHTDKQSITILVPLSYATSTDPDEGIEAAGAMAGSYSGGGTAFWSVHARAPHAIDDETAEAAATTIKRDEPTLVLRPPPRRAIVFGGWDARLLPLLEERSSSEGSSPTRAYRCSRDVGASSSPPSARGRS